MVNLELARDIFLVSVGLRKLVPWEDDLWVDDDDER